MVLVIDIETKSAIKGVVNPDTDTIQFIGCYEVEDDKEHFYSKNDKKSVQELINKHRIIVTFNGNHFDIPVMKREGYTFNRHIHIDMREVLKKRYVYLGLKINSFSLSNIAKEMKLKNLKQETFDYSILQKEIYNNKEIAFIKEYTMQDVRTTKEMFLKVKEFFEPLREYMKPVDRLTMKWMTSSIASYAYKVICHRCNLKEEYDEQTKSIDFGGGFVLEPTESEAHNDIIAFDFKSLYPKIYTQNNLFSQKCKCCTPEQKWTGDNYYEIHGTYCTKKQGKIEKLIQEFFNNRVKMQHDKDPREYMIKIIINSIYGAASKPVFKSIYNYNCARDCTSIGRTCIQTAIKMFSEAGIKVLYGDTDSCYVQTKNKELAKNTAKAIVTKLQSHMSMVDPEFTFKIDDEIKHIWFSTTGNKNNKKNYVYVTKEDKLKIVGLPLIKSDGSKIGIHIFNKHMKEIIIMGHSKFKYEQIKKWVYEELDKDPSICNRTFKVYNKEQYKLKSQIQYQIIDRYGEGIHTLIPNNSIGVGRGNTKYCTLQEYEEKGLTPYAIILNKMWNELRMFIKDFPVITKKINRNNRTLLEFTNIEAEE